MRIFIWGSVALLGLGCTGEASADQLYDGDKWAAVASDNKAQAVGDIVTILIAETASATNSVGNRSSRETNLSGRLGLNNDDEALSFGIDSRFRGVSETERSDRFLASMAAQVTEVLPGGNLLIVGRQHIYVNEERRSIELRGLVRLVDIQPNNTIASSRIAEAEINYDGKGYVTRSAKPGLLNRIFSFLGLL